MYKVIYTDTRPRGYPVLKCCGCPTIYHLSQNVRFDNEMKRQQIAVARTKGWDVNESLSESWCPSCAAPKSKYYVVIPPFLEKAMREFLANEPGGATVEVIVQSEIPRTSG